MLLLLFLNQLLTPQPSMFSLISLVPLNLREFHFLDKTPTVIEDLLMRNHQLYYSSPQPRTLFHHKSRNATICLHKPVAIMIVLTKTSQPLCRNQPRLLRLPPMQFLMLAKRMSGRRRSRPSSASIGSPVNPVKTRRKTKGADSLTENKNFNVKRD